MAAEQRVPHVPFNTSLALKKSSAYDNIVSALLKEGVGGAQLILGACYEDGEGVEQDKEEAVKWYRKAATNGKEDAKKALKRLGVDSE